MYFFRVSCKLPLLTEPTNQSVHLSDTRNVRTLGSYTCRYIFYAIMLIVKKNRITVQLSKHLHRLALFPCSRLKRVSFFDFQNFVIPSIQSNEKTTNIIDTDPIQRYITFVPTNQLTESETRPDDGMQSEAFFPRLIYIFIGAHFTAASEKTCARLMDKKGGSVYIYSVASFFTCERT